MRGSKLFIGVMLLSFSLVSNVEAVDTNRKFLSWESNQRSGYIMGAVDATNDWVGLNCPDKVIYAVLILYTQQFAERNPNGLIMETIGMALEQAGCKTGEVPKPTPTKKPTL